MLTSILIAVLSENESLELHEEGIAAFKIEFPYPS